MRTTAENVKLDPMSESVKQVPRQFWGFDRGDFGLTEQQWRYVLHRVTQPVEVPDRACAEAAGYSLKSGSISAIQMNTDINHAIATLDAKVAAAADLSAASSVLSREQGLTVLTDIAQNEDEAARDRIKAVEALARMQRWGESTGSTLNITIDAAQKDAPPADVPADKPTYIDANDQKHLGPEEESAKAELLPPSDYTDYLAIQRAAKGLGPGPGQPAVGSGDA